MGGPTKPRMRVWSMARPTKYRPDYPRQAKALCKLGATDKDLADAFSVSELTINRWKLEFPEFRKSLTRDKDQVDGQVQQRLFMRAMGYSQEAVKHMVVAGKLRTIKYTERFPPDVTACIFWLKNRQPALWRDKPEGVTGDSEELAAAIRQLLGGMMGKTVVKPPANAAAA